jgi:hypothetical protein
MNKKWDQRRLVDVSPLQMVAARHVIELVAKIAITVIEVNVKEEFGESDRPDQNHPVIRGECRSGA